MSSRDRGFMRLITEANRIKKVPLQRRKIKKKRVTRKKNPQRSRMEVRETRREGSSQPSTIFSDRPSRDIENGLKVLVGGNEVK